jgi:hypothetical protein
MFIGINPMNVAKKNLKMETSRIGDDIFMNQLGTIGVILRKSK